MKRKVLIDGSIYTLCKEPKFHVYIGEDIYDSYDRPSYAKVRAYKENYAWFDRLEKDDKCKWYGVQSHTCQHFSIAFSCLAEDKVKKLFKNAMKC